MDAKGTQPATRAPYEPPILKRIDLRTDEVLAPGCKTNASTAPGNAFPPCTLNNCALLGS